MVAKLTRAEQRNFIGLITAMGDGDGRTAACCILEFAKKSESGAPDPPYDAMTRENFTRDIMALFAVKCKGYRRGTDIGEVLRGVLSLCRKHHVTVPANYDTLVMNALCLDGMARSLLPGYNVLDSAEALLRLNKVVGRAPLLRNLLLPLANWLKRRHDAHFIR